jgi:hypothetical protein
MLGDDWAAIAIPLSRHVMEIEAEHPSRSRSMQGLPSYEVEPACRLLSIVVEQRHQRSPLTR